MTKMIAVLLLGLSLAGCASRNGRDGMDGLGVAMGMRQVEERRQ